MCLSKSNTAAILALLCMVLAISQGGVTHLREIKESSATFKTEELKGATELHFLPNRASVPGYKRAIEYWDADLQFAMVCSVLHTISDGTTEIEVANYTSCVTQSDVILAHNNMNYQHEVVYNEVEEQYLVVFIQQNGTDVSAETSLLGLLLDTSGTVLETIPIFTFEDDPNLKHNPAVTYNSRNNHYFVTFDYVTEGIDHDIGGVILNSEGAIIVDPFYIGTSYVNPGVDENPAVTFDSEGNSYIVVYEHIDTTDPTSHLIMASLAPNGYPLYSPILLSAVDEDDKNPQVIYNYDMGYFYMVWEVANSEEGDIYGVPLNRWGVPIFVPFLVAGTMFFNGTTIRDHNSRIAYSSSQEEYLLVWEVDVYGVENGPSHIVGRRLDAWGTPTSGLYAIGTESNVPHNRNPSITYSWSDNAFLIAYEAFNANASVVSVRFASIDAASMNQTSDFLVSPKDDNDYMPSIAYNFPNNTALIIWNRGFPVFTTTTDDQRPPSKVEENGVQNGGAIIGGVVGGIVGVGLIGGIVYFVIQRRKKASPKSFSKMENNDEEMR